MRGDIKLYNFDDSIVPSEIGLLFAEIGDCPLSSIKTSVIRKQRNGLNMAWVNCPLQLAIKIAKMGKISIGWSMAGVELLKKRPTRCFKCWHFGHLKNLCPNSTDRQGCCFRCGDRGHIFNTCDKPFKCCACLDLGFECNHRTGSSFCQAVNRLNKVRRTVDSGPLNNA